MAKRRALSRALAGLGEGIAAAGSYGLRRYAQEDAQKAIDDRSRSTQLAIADRQTEAEKQRTVMAAITELIKNGGDPEAVATLGDQLGYKVDASALDKISPPSRRLNATMGKQIGEAKSAEEVPSLQDILGDPASRLPAAWSSGMMPAENQNESDLLTNARPEAAAMNERADVKRRAFMSKPTQKVTGVDPTTGAPYDEMKSPYDMTTPTFTGPTAQRAGELKGQGTVAEKTTELGNDVLTELKGQAEGRIAAIADAITRPGKAATAAAVTGATERAKLAPDIISAEAGKAGTVAGATERAKLAPDIVAAEVDKANRLAEGKDNASQAERMAGVNFSPLIESHAGLLDLERKGTRMMPGAETATKSGILNAFVPEDQQQYFQAGRNFVSTIGQIRSGVAVPETEVSRFLATYLGNANDTPATMKQKQTSREIFIASMQAMVGRSGEEAGKILGEQIKSGRIPMSILPSLQFSNDKIQKGLLDTLGIPAFDANGNPLKRK